MKDRRLAHDYRREISQIAIDRARRNMERRYAPEPEPVAEEHITPLRFLGLVIFGIGMWGVLLYAVPILLQALTS